MTMILMRPFYGRFFGFKTMFFSAKAVYIIQNILMHDEVLNGRRML